MGSCGKTPYSPTVIFNALHGRNSFLMEYHNYIHSRADTDISVVRNILVRRQEPKNWFSEDYYLIHEFDSGNKILSL
jgi:hypothetical protein